MSAGPVIVIGGGAAGMMAAGQAALAGADVLVLEKMARPGRKLAITGKGRCNLTNTADLDDFLDHFSRSGRFLRQAFQAFFAPELIECFEGMGLAMVTERGGRVFPASGRAPDVVSALRHWLDALGVSVRCSAAVTDVVVEQGHITHVVAGGARLPCAAAIVATGGLSYPATGSTGDGYALAVRTGHRIVATRQALVPLKTKGLALEALVGLELRNVSVRLMVAGKKRGEAFGELTFTDFGVTGPTVLRLSGAAVDALGQSRDVVLSVDVKPGLDTPRLDARLLRDFAARGKEPMSSLLGGLLPRRLVPVALRAAGIAPDRPGNQVSGEERQRLRAWLKGWPIQIARPRPFDEAIVTAGGVDTRDVDPRTMESRHVAGLYFAGEVLDVQGDTGGYNLQAAFSTGWMAGQAAARRLPQ